VNSKYRIFTCLLKYRIFTCLLNSNSNKKLKHYSVKFNGKTSLDATDQWLKDIERIFDAKMCPVKSRLAFAVYMLTGEAEHWWINIKSVMEERGTSHMGSL